MKPSTGRSPLLLLLLLTIIIVILCSVLPAVQGSVQFEYCFWFRGSCLPSCAPHSFALYGYTWCSNRATRCCVQISTPPLADTTTTSTTTTKPAPSPQCGRKGGGGRLVTGRIVGGQPAGRCEFPWMVYIALKPGDSDPCGGALIDDRHVLTAAHCFSGLGDYTPQITIGEYSRDERHLPFDKYTTSDYKLIMHQQYEPQTFFNDIAILQLRTPVNFRAYRCVQPLCLPPRGTNFLPGTSCIAAGWGVTQPIYKIAEPPVSRVLRRVTLPIVDRRLCETRFGHFYNISTELCAGQLDGARDTCDGDSGGPLMCQSGSGSEYYLAGIVSSGVRCAQPHNPAIYTDVTRFLDWIHDAMRSG